MIYYRVPDVLYYLLRTTVRVLFKILGLHRLNILFSIPRRHDDSLRLSAPFERLDYDCLCTLNNLGPMEEKKTDGEETIVNQHIDKKARMDDYPMAPDEEWPEAWIMPDEVEEQCQANKLEPNVPVTVEQLKEIGINYWKMDANAYEYPIKSVPWDPKDATDPKLQALRDARGYSYADIITVHPDHLPEFDKKIKSFFEEHIHDAVCAITRVGLVSQ